MRPLDVGEVERIAFRLAQEHLRFDEPIPDFTTRFPNILESSLFAPFQKFGRKHLYQTFALKAAMLFYLMIKNHPFQNGNKRIAITTLLFFLNSNNKWFNVDIQEFYNFTIWVAASPADCKEQAVSAIEQFMTKHLVVCK
ncbi:MAG: type II toxin-antitoxin system death-on-curing family toxin [Phycisphaerae bacterium]|jgi:prophage maintenance system killer protein